MSPDNLKIEILAFAGCPNAEVARAHVLESLLAEGRQAEVIYVEVDTPELVEQERFLGSPSVRIDGKDVEPAARNRTDFGLMWRTYRQGTVVAGVPSVALIREAFTLNSAPRIPGSIHDPRCSPRSSVRPSVEQANNPVGGILWATRVFYGKKTFNGQSRRRVT